MTVDGQVVNDSAAEVAHMVDKYEKLVTDDLRMMQTQRALLHDALHALHNGNPQVVEEFIERTIDAMSKRVTAIRDR